MGAGDLARAVAEEEGRGGGHRSMARVTLDLAGKPPMSETPGDPDVTAWILERMIGGVDALRGVRTG